MGPTRGGVKFFSLQRRHRCAAHRDRVRVAADAANPGTLHTASTTALLICEGALIIYWPPSDECSRRSGRRCLWTAVIAGLVCVTLRRFDVSRDAPWLMPLLTVRQLSELGRLLGGACGAMVLGHWYLVVPSLNVSHLQSSSGCTLAPPWCASSLSPARLMIAIVSWSRACRTSSATSFRLTASFFGSASSSPRRPAVLSYLTWETAKIQSTQSATGILYVDFFTVSVGEVLAKYLLLSTKVPV